MEGDEDLIPHLKCDVELNFEGPNVSTLNKWAADALRNLANLVEKNELEDGWHDVKDNVGKVIGKLYVDYSGELI